MDKCKGCLNEGFLELIYDFEYIDIETEEKRLESGYICSLCGCIHIIDKVTNELKFWEYQKFVGQSVSTTIGSWVTNQMLKRK